jgi:hypothetical protein
MKASTNAGHSAATCTTLAGAVASAGFSAGSREQPVSSAATIRFVAAIHTVVRILDLLEGLVEADRISVLTPSFRGLARRYGFEAAKRVVETARIEEQVAERKLSARATAIQQRRVAQRGEGTDTIADCGQRDAERMPCIWVIRCEFLGNRHANLV